MGDEQKRQKDVTTNGTSKYVQILSYNDSYISLGLFCSFSIRLMSDTGRSI